MKREVLDQLASFESRLRALKAEVTALDGERIGRQGTRSQAETLANTWVEDLRSPLEHKFGIDQSVIADMSEQMKRLHVLSRPNNRRTSYLDVLNSALKNFKNRFVLPIQQAAFEVESPFDLAKLIDGLTDADESDYLSEAIACANQGHRRAAIVMGWCTAVDRIQRKIQALGLDAFNAASAKVKAQTTGKNKTWNKQFNLASLGDLQAVFDRDLIVVVEALELIDSNQANRLRVDFEYRNQSAHPGLAPIEDAHLVAFFSDICNIVLLSDKFAV